MKYTTIRDFSQITDSRFICMSHACLAEHVKPLIDISVTLNRLVKPELL